MNGVERYTKAPHEFKVSKRHWVVAVGEVAESILEERYGMKPSQELLESYVEETIGNLYSRQIFISKVGRHIKGEIDQALEAASKSGGSVGVVRNRVRVILGRKYRRLENDPARNFSYLEPLIINKFVSDEIKD